MREQQDKLHKKKMKENVLMAYYLLTMISSIKKQ